MLLMQYWGKTVMTVDQLEKQTVIINTHLLLIFKFNIAYIKLTICAETQLNVCK